jgi:hypothetical protein
MPGRHLPADHSLGDESTLGGYAAVHGRPPALEGTDGMSYSVELVADGTGDAVAPRGAFILFLRWRRMGTQAVEGHLESDFLVRGTDDNELLERLGRMKLLEAQEILDKLVAADEIPSRPWWEAMNDDDS